MPHIGTGQGSNSANLRQFNERVVLTALRRLGRASKADLARASGLTENTAGVIVKELLTRRLLRVEGKRTGARGQPATLLSLDPDGAFAIGVKIGRRSIDAALVDFDGGVLAQRRVDRAFPPPDEALDAAVALVAELRGRLPADGAERLCGIGLAMPFNMGSWRRELDIPEAAYAAWNSFDLAGELNARTGLRPFTENDGTAAAIAELFASRNQGPKNFLYVFVGTAVGGGVVLNGSAFRGAHGNAGDIGLMPVPPSKLASVPKPDRAYDILLSCASLSSLIRHLRCNGIDVEGRDELERALGGEVLAPVAEWIDAAAEALVVPVLSAMRILDLDTVVVDADLPPHLLNALIDRLAARLAATAPEARTAPDVRRGTVGRSAAAIGAAILPLHYSFAPSPDILVGAAAPGSWASSRQAGTWH